MLKWYVLTHWDTWVTGTSEISRSVSVSISSAMLLLLRSVGRCCTSKIPGFLPKDTQTHIISDWDVFAFSNFNKPTKLCYLPGGVENWKEDREFQMAPALWGETSSSMLSTWHHFKSNVYLFYTVMDWRFTNTKRVCASIKESVL